MIDHKKADVIRDAARKRLTNHMHAFDVSAAVTGEMSLAKQDGTFAGELDRLLRYAVTLFDPQRLVDDAEEAMG